MEPTNKATDSQSINNSRNKAEEKVCKRQFTEHEIFCVKKFLKTQHDESNKFRKKLTDSNIKTDSDAPEVIEAKKKVQDFLEGVGNLEELGG